MCHGNNLADVVHSKGNISTCSATPLLPDGNHLSPDSANSSRTTTTTNSADCSETSSLNDEVMVIDVEHFCNEF